MPTSCTFQLDRLNPVYNSGEYIKGRILLKTDKVKRVNAVYVSLEGEAKVQWSISGKETANYFGHQQYLHSRASVFDNTEFSAGTHIYVLTLRIPQDCPSSCAGPYGYIAYHMSLVIDKPRSFNEVFRQPITVVQTLDLNLNPDYALSLKEENMKFLCRWPCSSGPLNFSLSLPYVGYTPGQYIKFQLELDNQSPHYDVWAIEASLKQHFVFLARKPLKRNYHSKTLYKMVIEERTLRLSKRLYEACVYVPTNTPRSTLNLNYIVFLHYSLQVKLKTGCFHYDADISLPVIIGTTPIREFLVEQRALESQTNVVDCSRAWGAEVCRGLITTQPTLRLQQELNNLLNYTIITHREDMNHGQQPRKSDKKNDEPPSYDSCLPPSFSFATLGSHDTLDSTEPKLKETKRSSVHLPPFPSYNTFSNPSDSLLDVTTYQGSYGSLCTDHTGRSLDTLDVLNVRGDAEDNEEHIYAMETTQVQIENNDEAVTNSTS
uniref:Arrestin_C domain-containing protein n=1 Tax=Glossina brevipalpis TaxID=37001 RepID=A0A1A9W1M0_9MUSC